MNPVITKKYEKKFKKIILLNLLTNIHNMKKKLNLLPFILLSIGFVVFLSGCTTNIKPTQDKFINNKNVNNNTNPVSDKIFTMQEVNQHSSRNDCWTVIEGKVYDITEYILSGKHKPVITEGCGINATDKFNNVEKHSKSKLDKYYIGDLK